MTTINISDIKEHSSVIAVCGTKVGDVDHIEGKEIKLTKHGDGKHHIIPSAWVREIREDQVMLSKDAQEIKDNWIEAQTQKTAKLPAFGLVLHMIYTLSRCKERHLHPSI